jgi:hypothetical protein
MKRCSDPHVGGQIALEIGFNIAQRKDIHLTPEQSRHLVQCEECNQLLPLWFKKGEAARKNDAALNIVDLAEADDSRILKKNTQSGTALFKSHEDDSSKGLLVEISSTGAISPAQEVTLDEFNRLE